MKRWKRYAVAALAALAFVTPLSAEAHILSSAQEKNIGTKAANAYAKKYTCRENAIVTHIQDRLMSYNSDKLWMYGTSGHKRGLERILVSDDTHINAVSYGGGQIFVYQGLMDFLSMKFYSNGQNYASSNVNPWKKCNIYQMSALAGVVGHEMGHWENEDMLKEADARFATAGIVALIPVANIYTALLAAAGGNIINMFSSRQLSFDAEQAADEKGIEYCGPVPEYSIGGTAIWHYRDATVFPDSKSFDNWLHPHSKSGKRLERALTTMSSVSKGFFEWRGIDLYVDGDLANYLVLGNNEEIVLAPRDDVTWRDRTFYVIGQLSSCIDFNIADRDNLQYKAENEVFSDGSPNNTVLLMTGTDHRGRKHSKIIDSYHVEKRRLVQLLWQFERYWDSDKKALSEVKRTLTSDEINDLNSLVVTRKILEKWEDRKYHYMMKVRY